MVTASLPARSAFDGRDAEQPVRQLRRRRAAPARRRCARPGRCRARPRPGPCGVPPRGSAPPAGSAPPRRSRASATATSATTFGREALGRLVDQQQPVRPEQHPAEREHLLFAAGERAGRLRRALPQHREQLVDQVVSGAGAVRGSASRRFSRDGQRREDAAVLGHVADAGAGDPVRRQARESRRRRTGSRRSTATARGSRVRSWSCRRRCGRAARSRRSAATSNETPCRTGCRRGIPAGRRPRAAAVTAAPPGRPRGPSRPP